MKDLETLSIREANKLVNQKKARDVKGIKNAIRYNGNYYILKNYPTTRYILAGGKHDILPNKSR